MADTIQGSGSTMTATKMDLIAAVVQRELIEASKLTGRVTDWSFLAEPGSKQVEILKTGSFTVTNRAEGTAGDASALTYTADVMPLDFNAYVSWIVDYKSKVQSRIDVQMDLAARAARAHAFYLEQQLIAKLESAGQPTATAGDISYAICLEMREKFLANDGDLAKSTLLVGTDQEAILLDIDEFKKAEVYGSAVIPSGVIGRIHGMDVVVSNKVAADSYYLFDKDAIGFALQAGPSYSEQGANQYGSQAVRAVLDQLFGTWAGFLGQKGAGPTQSALIIKDAN
jgi:hypothetical protein